LSATMTFIPPLCGAWISRATGASSLASIRHQK
jgi:hypothetical protein